MTRQFTAQVHVSLSRDKKLLSLHGSRTIVCDDVVEQLPKADAKHFCM